MGVGDIVFNGVGAAGATSSVSGFDLRISGNTLGTTALVSSGTLTLNGGSNITLSQSGNAITILGGPTPVTNQYFRPFNPGTPTAQTFGNGSLWIFPVQVSGWATATQVNLQVSASISTSSNSSFAAALTMSVGFFTRSGSTLNLLTASSGVTNWQFSNTSNNSTVSLSNARILTVPINMNLTPGDYWIGFISSTASTNANWITISNIANTNNQISGYFAAATNASDQWQQGFGHIATASMPASVSFGALLGNDAPRVYTPLMMAFVNQS